MTKPPCFTDEQWDSWSYANSLCIQTDRRHYCHDCLPFFALMNRLCGKCKHPEVRFISPEGGLIGVFPETGELF